jgi:hypothetical protein
MRNRGFNGASDTRVWSIDAGTVAGTVVIRNTATNRCLQPGKAMGFNTAVLLPCDSNEPLQRW